MERSQAAYSIGVALAVATATAAGLAGQAIEGRVVLDGWEEPVAYARVDLFDEGMATIAATTAGEDGSFSFPAVEPGTYYLQAQHGGLFGPVSAAVELARADDAERVVLTLPSPLLDLARRCFTGAREPGTGVLTGVTFEAATEMPLPYARIRIQWDREGSPRGERTVLADGAGRFALCGVPAGMRISAWVEALGSVTRADTDFVVTRDAIARLDLPLELGRAGSVRVIDTAEGQPDGGVVVQGRVVDADTGTPVSAAAVVLGETGRQYVTDRQGRFRFEDVAPGSHDIAVRGLGYELEPQPLELPEAASVELELRVSPQALALAPLVVRTFTPEQQAVRAAPHAQRVMAGERLRFAEQRGQRIPDIVREFPSIWVNRGTFETEAGVETGVCIESTAAMRRLTVPERRTDYPWCEMVTVVLDGVVIGRVGDLFETIPTMDIESIESLRPLAAIQWGLQASANGALVIWTRGRGPHARRSR
jgi:hypothetical protein